MSIYNGLVSKTECLSLIGLGYVGLPIAAAFSEKLNVIGYDCNTEKIETYKKGIDVTKEIGDSALKSCRVLFTSEPSELKKARFHIIAVPTPLRGDKTPDLSPLEKASSTLGRNLQKGSIVVYESTVYPGVTEDFCVPVLEKESGLKCGEGFFVGYSPERINPGDKVHRLQTIVKVVSGMDDKTLDEIARAYELVVEAGVYRAPSIRVAEAAKVIENSQRDINIAFMNELSIIFNKMGIDTLEVLKAAETKWNFLSFKPGLVGGHCIGIDPYYLTYCAEQLDYHSQVILAGRRINDSMGKIVAENTVKLLIKQGVQISGAHVAILGLTFKEDCPDMRNTRVMDIIAELREYGIIPTVCDPVADVADAKLHYGLELTDIDSVSNADALIVAVGHTCFKDIDVAAMLKPDGVLADIKGFLDKREGYKYWRL